MEKTYKLIVLIEGSAKKILDLKERITGKNGEFNPYKYFETLIDDEELPSQLFERESDMGKKYKSETQDKYRLLSAKARVENSPAFQSFWNASINGITILPANDLHQLLITYEADEIEIKEWYSISVKFPELFFFVRFVHFDDYYQGEIVIDRGEVFYNPKQSYLKDKNGYSIVLSDGNRWKYVIHPKSKLEGKISKCVLQEDVVPLKEQMDKIKNPIEFCRFFPYELFHSWLYNEDNYFNPRPDTLIHPDMLPGVVGPDDDFDIL
jgi:hypothetical protein